MLVRGLRKSHGDVQALPGVDLEVERGEVFGFLGPNGAASRTARELIDLRSREPAWALLAYRRGGAGTRMRSSSFSSPVRCSTRLSSSAG